jgi:hypothetical protein
MLELYLEYGLLFLGLCLLPVGGVVLVVAAFKRNRNGLLIGTAFLALAAILVLRVRYAEFWLVDSCLDQGGAWNESTQSCEY